MCLPVNQTFSLNGIYLLNIEQLEARLDQVRRALSPEAPAGPRLSESGFFGKSDYRKSQESRKIYFSVSSAHSNEHLL